MSTWGMDHAPHSAAGACLRMLQHVTIWVGYLVFAVAVVAFLRWLVLIIRASRGLGGELKTNPTSAVLSFFIPIANFVLPVRDLRAIASALAPDRLPEPPVRIVADGSAGYREARLVAPPAATPLPAALINLWWVTYYIVPFGIGTLVAVLTLAHVHPMIYGSVRVVKEVVGTGVQLIAAFCAMRMVRALTLLLEERLRRVRHNTEDVLRQVGLVLE